MRLDFLLKNVGVYSHRKQVLLEATLYSKAGTNLGVQHFDLSPNQLTDTIHERLLDRVLYIFNRGVNSDVTNEMVVDAWGRIPAESFSKSRNHIAE